MEKAYSKDQNKLVVTVTEQVTRSYSIETIINNISNLEYEKRQIESKISDLNSLLEKAQEIGVVMKEETFDEAPRESKHEEKVLDTTKSVAQDNEDTVENNLIE